VFRNKENSKCSQDVTRRNQSNAQFTVNLHFQNAQLSTTLAYVHMSTKHGQLLTTERLASLFCTHRFGLS
jgi:hypothetical protein